MRTSHRMSTALGAAALALVPLLTLQAWPQTPDPSAPPTAPSLTTSQEHAAHPDVQPGSPDTGHSQSLQLTDPRPTAGTDPDPLAAKVVSDFISRATIDGLTEIQLAHLALNRSQNEGVQQLAQQVLADYEQSDSALSAVAIMKNVSVPKEIDAPHQAVVQSLSAKQGQAFDAAYIDQMLSAHQRAITLYTAAAGQTDSEVAAFAYKALPTLKTHRHMAQSLKSTGRRAA